MIVLFIWCISQDCFLCNFRYGILELKRVTIHTVLWKMKKIIFNLLPLTSLLLHFLILKLSYQSHVDTWESCILPPVYCVLPYTDVFVCLMWMKGGSSLIKSVYDRLWAVLTFQSFHEKRHCSHSCVRCEVVNAIPVLSMLCWGLEAHWRRGNFSSDLPLTL